MTTNSQLSRVVRRARREIRDIGLAQKLAHLPGYSFTIDFVSSHLAHWAPLLRDFQHKPNVRILEIGSYEGRSAVWFLENILTDESSTIDCVDLFSHVSWERRFDHNIRASGSGHKVTKRKGASEAVLSTLPLSTYDVIYVDGGHHAVNVLMDSVLSWKLLKKGGVMIFDDYLLELYKPAHLRPQMAIDLFLELYSGHYDLLLKDYQVSVRKTTA